MRHLPAVPRPRDDAALKRSTLHSVKWNFVATVADLVGRLAFTFALAHILGPDAFGVVAVASVFLAFVSVGLDQSLSLLLIQKEQLDRDDVGSVLWLNIGAGVLLTGLTLLLSTAIADFFNTPEVDLVLKALSVTLLLRSLVMVPIALLRRDLRFKEHALAQTVATLVGGVAGIASALAGADYWALVVQNIVTQTIVVGWILLVVGRISMRASWRSTWAAARFSSHLLGAALLGYLGANADNLLVARLEGPTQLAFYALAFRLLRLPVQLSGSVVNSVAVPVLSRMQDDDDASRSWFLVATQSLALLTFPVFALLAVGAPAGIDVVFGPEWEPAAAPLQAMALAGVPLVVRSLVSGLAASRGMNRIVLAWSSVTVALQVVGFAVGLWAGGIVGVAISLVVVQYLTWFPYVADNLRRVLGTGLRDYLRVLVAPVLASAAAAGVWWLVQAGQGGLYDAPGLVRISLSTVLALAAYLAMVRLGWPRVYGSTASLLRQMGRRGGVAPVVVSPDPVAP